jgi:hypothetical protein
MRLHFFKKKKQKCNNCFPPSPIVPGRTFKGGDAVIPGEVWMDAGTRRELIDGRKTGRARVGGRPVSAKVCAGQSPCGGWFFIL